MSRQMLTKMNPDQLQTIIDDLHAHVECKYSFNNNFGSENQKGQNENFQFWDIFRRGIISFFHQGETRWGEKDYKKNSNPIFEVASLDESTIYLVYSTYRGPGLIPFLFFGTVLNEQLMKMLMERDELHMSRDSLLVDIDDITAYL